jgi:hypothetical protein
MINGSNGNSIWDNPQIFNAAAGVALIFAGASLLLANPQTREYIKDGLRAAFPDLDVEKLEQPLALGMQTVLPDLERYLRLRSM